MQRTRSSLLLAALTMFEISLPLLARIRVGTAAPYTLSHSLKPSYAREMIFSPLHNIDGCGIDERRVSVQTLDVVACISESFGDG